MRSFIRKSYHGGKTMPLNIYAIFTERFTELHEASPNYMEQTPKMKI